MELGSDYQQELVLKLADPKFLALARGHLHPEEFDPGLDAVVREVLKRKQGLSKAQIRQVALGQGIKLPKSTSGCFEFDQEQLELFSKIKLARRSLSEAHLHLERGEIDEAYAVVDRGKLRNASMNGHAGHYDVLESNRPEPVRRHLLSTMLPTLDTAFQGGVAGGDLAMVMAPTSGGKSSWLVFQACEAAKAGKKVYYATLEVPDYEIESKVRRCLMGKAKISKAEWEKTARARRKAGGRLLVRAFPPRSVSIGELDATIPEVDAVFIDYADYVRPPKHETGTSYEALGFIYESMKRLAMERDIPVWTASQVNRASYQNRILTTSDVEMSLRKAMISDQVITLNQDEADKHVDPETGNTFAVLGVAKNRHGQRDQEIPMTVNWAKCSFSEGGLF